MSVPGLRSSSDLDGVLRVYREPLRRFFTRRVRDRTDVDDLVQDVYCRLINRGGISGISEIKPYIFQTANNVLRDHLRRGVTHGAGLHDNSLNELPDEDASPERVLLGKEAVEQFAQALSELPDRTRTIFILSRLKNLDYKEISRQQAISVSAVEKHIAKTLAHLVLRLKN